MLEEIIGDIEDEHDDPTRRRNLLLAKSRRTGFTPKLPKLVKADRFRLRRRRLLLARRASEGNKGSSTATCSRSLTVASPTSTLSA